MQSIIGLASLGAGENTRWAYPSVALLLADLTNSQGVKAAETLIKALIDAHNALHSVDEGATENRVINALNKVEDKELSNAMGLSLGFQSMLMEVIIDCLVASSLLGNES